MQKLMMKAIHKRRGAERFIAQLKDAQSKLSMEECVLVTGQRSNFAAVRDAQIKLSMEECALNMGQRGQGSDVDLKSAKIMSSMEECALGMERKSRSDYAASMGAQT